VTVLAQVAESLKLKIAAEATIMRGHLQAMAACQERIDEMQSKVEEIEAVLAEEPQGQPQLYAVL
jgi:hypothetical protein